MRLEPPVLLGAGCLVESEAELIGPLIVGDGCVIERGAVLEGVIHWAGVKTGRGSRLAGSILGRHVVVHHEAVVHEDAVIGDRTEVAAHALVPAGRALRTALVRRRRRLLAGDCAASREHAARGLTPGGIVDGLLDLVFPKRCVQCGAAGAWLCEPCAGDLRPLPEQRCPRCGRPGRVRRRPDARQRRRAAAAPSAAAVSWRSVAAAAAFTYEGPARALVTACKFRALRSLADEMRGRAAVVRRSPWRPRPGGRPRHLGARPPRPQLERGFNQAELLARGLARRVGVPYAPLLRRVRHGARQSGLDRAGARGERP